MYAVISTHTIHGYSGPRCMTAGQNARALRPRENAEYGKLVVLCAHRARLLCIRMKPSRVCASIGSTAFASNRGAGRGTRGLLYGLCADALHLT